MEERKTVSPSGEISTTQADDASKTSPPVALELNCSNNASNSSLDMSGIKVPQTQTTSAESQDAATNTSKVLTSKSVCTAAAQSVSVQAGMSGTQLVENLNELHSVQTVNDRCPVESNSSGLQSVQSTNEQGYAGELQFPCGANDSRSKAKALQRGAISKTYHVSQASVRSETSRGRVVSYELTETGEVTPRGTLSDEVEEKLPEAYASMTPEAIAAVYSAQLYASQVKQEGSCRSDEREEKVSGHSDSYTDHVYGRTAGHGQSSLELTFSMYDQSLVKTEETEVSEVQPEYDSRYYYPSISGANAGRQAVDVVQSSKHAVYANYSQPSETGVDLSTIATSSVASSEMGLSLDQTLSEIRAASYAYGQIARSLNRETSSAPPAQASEYDSPQVYSQLARRLSQESFVSLAPRTSSSQYEYSTTATESDFAINDTITSVSQNLENNYERCPQSSSNIGSKVTNAARSRIEPDYYMYQSTASGASSFATDSNSSQLPPSGYNFSKLTAEPSQSASIDNAVQTSRALDYSQSGGSVSSTSVHAGTETRDINAPTSGSFSSSSIVPNYGYSLTTIAAASSCASHLPPSEHDPGTRVEITADQSYSAFALVPNYSYPSKTITSSKHGSTSDSVEGVQSGDTSQSITSAVDRHYISNTAIVQHSGFEYENPTANSSSTSLETSDSSYSYSHDSLSTNQDDSVLHEPAEDPELESAYYPQTTTPIDLFHNYAMLAQSVTGSGLSNMGYEHVNALDHSYYTALQTKATPLYAEETSESQDERYDDELHLGMSNVSQDSVLYQRATNYTDYSGGNYSGFSSNAKDRGQAYSYQEPGGHLQSDAADAQYQLQYMASPSDPALDKENYAQLVQAGLATSTYIPEKHAEINHNQRAENDKALYSESSKMATPKTENTDFVETASCSQFSNTPSSGQSTSLPQIATLVQLNSMKENVLYFTPDGIGTNILPRISSFTQSSNAFSSMNSNDIKGPLKDYLLCSLASQLPSVKRPEQSLHLPHTSTTYNPPDTTPVQSVKMERKEEKTTNGNQLKMDRKVLTFADAAPSTVIERLSQTCEITNQSRIKDSAHGRSPRAPSAAAGSAAQLPIGSVSSTGRSDLPRPSGSTSSHRNATAKQPRRRKLEDTSKEFEKRTKVEVVTCEPDSTQQGDPPEERLRSATVSQATRERHARGFYVHLPTRLQIFKPTPDDSNEISSTVEVCESPVFGVPVIGEEEEVSSGSGVSGVPITSHVAMATASCCSTVAKEVEVVVEPTVTMKTSVAVEPTCGEDNIASPIVAIGPCGDTMETVVAKDNITPSKQKHGSSVAGTSRDYEDPAPVQTEELLKKMCGPTKNAKRPEGLPAMSKQSEEEEGRSEQTSQPVHHEQNITSEVSCRRQVGTTLAAVENAALEPSAPHKKRGRPRKTRLSQNKEIRQENESSAPVRVATDEVVRSASNTPKTKRKAGRPKKIERTPPTPSAEQYKHPMRHNLRKPVAGNSDTVMLDVAPLAGSCGPEAASKEMGNLITLPSELKEGEKYVDDGASKTRKRKLADGDDHEGAYNMRKRKLTDGDDWVGASKTKKQLEDRGDQERKGKMWKRSTVGDGEDHASNVELLDSNLEIDLRELPQIRKKFPRKRKPEQRVNTQSEADKMVQSNDDNVKTSERAERNQSDDDTGEKSLDKEGTSKTLAETSVVGPGAIIKPCSKPPKKKVTNVETAKPEVELTGDEVGKKKRGRPKKDKIIHVDRGSVIPDSAIPDWVVQKSLRGGKYNSYNYQQKEDLLKLAEEFGGRAVASKLNIPVSTISCWKRTFKKDANRDPTSGRKIGSGRKLCYGNEVDELILQWILECRDLHRPTTVDDIGNYAGKIVRQVDGCESFKASHGWVAKFRNRHVAMLDGRTPMSQKLPPKLENLITQFQRQIHEIRQEYSIDPSLIINMDEVPIYFDLTGKKMKTSTKVKQEVVVRVTIGRKQHLTLLGAVTGEGKGLKPMLVMKGKSDADIDTPPHCILQVTDKGSVDQGIMVEWIQRVLLPYTHGRPSLLVIDSYEPHRVEFIMDLFSKYNVIVAVIPEGCNSRLQPVSISVCKLFRSHLKESWFHTVNEAVSKLANMPSAHWTNEEMESVAKWVVKGWEKVWRDNLQTIKKSFKVCGISNAVDGSESNLIRNDSYLDVTSFCQEQDHDKAHGFWY
ncbi:serine-rich adhesin for platelets-like [Lineus longissimus]|uniref:serine-rich adhesin for platelets-like n=1 Tax=Lineus longissimus TaxID=88925 RepID=UPI00315D8544